MDFSQQYQNQIDWLLSGDPAIKYQASRDLLFLDEFSLNKLRNEISQEGWGKKLLDLQDTEGIWSKGVYTPKWTSTFYTLLLLKSIGMKNNSRVSKACSIILDKTSALDGGVDVSSSKRRSDVCVTGMFLGIISHFEIKDERIEKYIEFLVHQQMEDGGWNCEYWKGATHASFHTTLSVLEGLSEYLKMAPKQNIGLIKEMQNKGVEFLLRHRLYKSHRTGEIVKQQIIRFSWPAYWKYDVMKALDYLQSVRWVKDERIEDAINLLKEKQNKDGSWNLQNKHAGKVFFNMESVGKPSRWNTLRALRILKWWED